MRMMLGANVSEGANNNLDRNMVIWNRCDRPGLLRVLACPPLGGFVQVPLWEVWYASRSRCFVWCLWCLFRAEIGAIYAEQLKELQKKRP